MLEASARALCDKTAECSMAEKEAERAREEFREEFRQEFRQEFREELVRLRRDAEFAIDDARQRREEAERKRKESERERGEWEGRAVEADDAVLCERGRRAALEGEVMRLRSEIEAIRLV